MIEVKNLTKKYGNHIAVDDLSFTVETGQIYGFLGPNGAGKSTTMNIITGYLAATDGTVLIDGTNIQTQPELAKSKVGYLPELPPLYMDMTVREYLDFVAELKGIAKEDRKEQVDTVMEMTQISDMHHRLIRNLSKGYRQRVGMAQAILGNPDVLIFDEPTVGLDPKQIIEVRDLIKELGKTHTIILSSHILSEVSAVCDHIMIISKGKLVASDSPEGLQKMMGSKSELIITVLGSCEKALEVLEQVKGAEEIVSEGTDEQGNGKIKIVAAANVDMRETVSLTLAENKIAVMGMERKEKSLEEIFLELTDGSGDTVEKESDNKSDASDNTSEENGEKAEAIKDEEEKSQKEDK